MCTCFRGSLLGTEPGLSPVTLTCEWCRCDLEDLALLSLEVFIPWFLFHVFVLWNSQIHPIQCLPSEVPPALCPESRCSPRNWWVPLPILPQPADEESFRAAAGLMKTCVQIVEEQ